MRSLRRGRPVVAARRRMSAAFDAAVTTVAILAGLALSAFILVVAGVPAEELANEFIVNTLTDADNLRAVLAQAAPLAFVGVGAALAFRVRFWNLGLEGQMIAGSVAATAIALADVGPPVWRLFLMLVAAMAAGMAWALVPALLKLRLGVNEVISSLLLNYVALNFLLHLLYGSWKDPVDAFPHSPAFDPFERLPDLGWGLNAALPLVAAAAVFAAWLLGRSRAGFYMRFVHANPSVALAKGLPVAALVLTAVLLSGGYAALAGVCLSVGQEGRLTQAFFAGYGFSGILIAFLARNNALAAVVVAFLVAVLFVSGQSLQVFYQIPFAMVRLIEAIVIISAAASEFFLRYQVRWLR